MRIGELARTVGVSADTIRFYERAGLLPRPSRSENRYREYSDLDADHLRLRPTAHLRYATDNDWLIVKTRTIDSGGIDALRELFRALMKRPGRR